MLQNSLLILFLFFSSFLYGTDNTLHDRSISDVNLISGSKATNIPYGFYINGFQKSSIEAFKNVDLAQYPNKKLFVGYGVYDIDDKNCRYLDVPSNSDLPQYVKNIKKLGNNTYGVSFSRMTFSQCKALASRFSGYVYTPNNPSEYQAVTDALNNTIGGETPKDFWIGYSRPDCSSPYLNDEGYSQSYVKFRFKNEICSSTNKLTYTNAGSKLWMRTGDTDQHYCPIVIHSPDYLRPIKYCAPWWRVERSWKLKSTDGLYEINGKTYDYRYAKYIIDYPKDVTICTETNASNSNDVSNGRFQFTCRSYDDIKASPACLESITLPQCHVNECQGYAENTCVKVDEIKPFKDYDIGYIMKDGVETKVKTRDNKLINVYDCPVPNPPASSCLKKEIVSVLPVECPNSQCAELADCFKDKTTPNDECLANYKCEKNYGSVDNVLYRDGVAYGLGGVCSDGSQVTALIERKSGINRRCLRYNEYTETNTTIKKCTSTANSSLRTVDTSITGTDIYEDDPRCIRVNNIEEARPQIETVFQYETKGFFKTAINKAFVNGESQRNDVNVTSSYLLSAASIKLKERAVSIEQTVPDASDLSNNYCTNNFSSSWYTNRYSVFDTMPIKGIVYNKTGSSTRKVSVYSSSGTGLHYIFDDFGSVNTASNWGVAVVNPDSLKIESFSTFDLSGTSGATSMQNFLSSIPNGKIVAVNTFGNPQQNMANNSALKNEMSKIGADTAILSALTSSSTYLLVGKKGSSRISEKTGTSDVSYTYSSSVQVPEVLYVSNGLSSCGSDASSLGLSVYDASYGDYNFADIGVTKIDIENGKYCLMGGNSILGDSMVSSVENRGTPDLFYNFTSAANSDCETIASCLSGAVKSVNNCKVEVDGSNNVVDLNMTYQNITTPAESVLTESSGSFKSDFNGYKDIFSVQEYTDGDFGYVSNYMFKLPLNNIVKLENKEVSPIIQQTPVISKQLYDYNTQVHTQTTKNRSPDNYSGSFSGIEGATTGIGDALGSSTVADLAYVASVMTGVGIIMLVFGGVHHFGWYDTTYSLYQRLDVPTFKHVDNVYGYDPRIIKNGVLLWDYVDLHSGTMESGAYEKIVSDAVNIKKTKYLNYGYAPDVVQSKLLNSVDRNWNIGYESIKWYKFSDKKTKSSATNATAVHVSKPINTIFMGAVNDVSIVVPYVGDYEVKAYDKSGNVLGTVVAQEQNFMKNTTATSGNVAQTYAKIQFATADNFNIAPGQDGQLINGSCLSSNFVEWGGGVSGVYYEEGVPDLGAGNNNCKKSNDIYVKEHAAVKLTVRAINSPDVFTIDLVKPLPFANRVFLVNLSNLENRKYQCYDSLNPCTINNP